jgi:hypothetical protein
MRNFDWDRAWLGFVLGILGPLIVMICYYFFNYSYMTLGGFMNYLKQGETHAPLLSLCVLLNLVPFYLLINREHYQGTKGVLAATFFWAALVVYFKFFY